MKDGGSALPGWFLSEKSKGHMLYHEGMSLRDYITVAALQGMLSNPRYDPTDAFIANGEAHRHLAKEAKRYTDALLKQRATPDA